MSPGNGTTWSSQCLRHRFVTNCRYRGRGGRQRQIRVSTQVRLLVAEDDAALRSILSRGLHEEGYVVDTVVDGDSAAEYLRAYEYDVAIIDWRMPKANGLEVIVTQLVKKELAGDRRAMAVRLKYAEFAVRQNVSRDILILSDSSERRREMAKRARQKKAVTRPRGGFAAVGSGS